MTPAVRQKIEVTLLLPASEIYHCRIAGYLGCRCRNTPRLIGVRCLGRQFHPSTGKPRPAVR
ncbi:MAG: hypothetical protein KME26_03285 [Oscillatoria princeps RMCB-10]|nr:hypothetical protein [Oscillatoria princeps RMCB-10]